MLSRSNFDDPLNFSKTIDNVSPISKSSIVSSEPETTDTEQNLRRSSRPRAFNRRYEKDYISPMTSSKSLSQVLSPKRNLSSSNDLIPVNVKENVLHNQRKKVKKLPSAGSSDKQRSTLNKQLLVAVLGSLHLTWPKYGINDGI